MKKAWIFQTLLVLSLILSACTSSLPGPAPLTSLQPTSTEEADNTPEPVSAANPCIGSPAPPHWHHVVILMFENKNYDKVIGPAAYITGLANKCATSTDWMDADTKVDGSKDGQYNSKPNYANL